MKRLAAFVLAMLLVLATFAGCASKQAADPAKDPAAESKDSTSASTDTSTAADAEGNHELRIAVAADPGDLSPHGYCSVVYYKDQLYDTLFHLDCNQEYSPMLCKSWDRVDDTHYRMHLRDDIYDCAGNHITASDVMFSLKMAKEGVNYSGQIAEIDVDNSTVEDDYTFVIAMSVPNDFAFYGGLGMICIVSEKAWNESSDGMVATPVGTGAYKLKKWTPGTEVILERNDKYWGEKPYFDTVYFEVIPEPSQMTTALELGEVDLVMNLQKSDVEYVNSLDNLTVTSVSTLEAYGLWFNMSENSVMQNKDLRTAVAYAIDNEAIAKVAMGGFGIPAVSACSTVMTDYDAAMNNDMYAKRDVDKAKEFMAKSGVPEGTTITLITNGGTEETAVMSAIQNMLTDIGLTAKIVSYEPATYFSIQSDPTSGWDICIENFTCPSGYGLDLWYKYLGFLNHSKWSGKEWEDTIAFGKEGIETVDEAERMQKSVEFIQKVEDTVPVYLLAQKTICFGHKDNLNFMAWDRQNVHCAELMFK